MAGFVAPASPQITQGVCSLDFRFVLWGQEEALNSSEGSAAQGLKQLTDQGCSVSESCSIRE